MRNDAELFEEIAELIRNVTVFSAGALLLMRFDATLLCFTAMFLAEDADLCAGDATLYDNPKKLFAITIKQYNYRYSIHHILDTLSSN